MTLLLGVDEAGYGPNLGPLVIAATVWEVDPALSAEACDERVVPVITRTAPARGDSRLWVADSKQIYKPPGGLPILERHVLPFLSLAGAATTSVAALWTALDAESAAERHREPWYEADATLPIAESNRVALEANAMLGKALESAGIRLRAIRARIVSPERFNRILDQRGSKGVLLSETTLELVASLWPTKFDEPAVVYCDRHGGRSRYADLLQHVCGERMVVTLSESSEVSRYRIGSTEVRFAVRSERYLPVALASMTAKYLRELLMRQFNAWWKTRIPGLAPTAGYPVDAKRFWDDTAVAREELSLSNQILWRAK
jgi:ribonuclease HII